MFIERNPLIWTRRNLKNQKHFDFGFPSYISACGFIIFFQILYVHFKWIIIYLLVPTQRYFLLSATDRFDRFLMLIVLIYPFLRYYFILVPRLVRFWSALQSVSVFGPTSYAQNNKPNRTTLSLGDGCRPPDSDATLHVDVSLAEWL